MKLLNLILWVGQFGFSVIFPTLVFLLLGSWLQSRFSLGLWVILACGVLGVLTSVRTTRSCLDALQKAAKEVSGEKESTISFNNHT